MSDVYKVGVSILLTSNATQVFGALGKHFLGLENQLKSFQNNWSKTAKLIGGGLAVFAGSAVLKGTAKLVEHGNELVKIQRDMAQAGVNATQIQESYAKSWQMTARYQNMSAVEILKMQNDARMTFGDQGAATHHIDDFVQMASFLKAYQGGAHAGKSDQLLAEVNAAMKSGELAGKINPEDMAEHVKQLTAMKVAYGDQLKIGQYLTAQRAGGVALRNSSDDFRYGMFPALVQENGPGAGVMLMTAFNKIVAGAGNRTKSLEHMAEIGLLKKDQLEYNKSGMIKGLKDPSAIMNNRDAAINFGDWVMKTFKPLIDAKTTDPIRQAQMISAMFPDRNAAKAITEIIQQYRKLAKDAEQMARARAAMDAAGYNAGSWDYQTQAFSTQWTNLLDALGAPMVKQATEMLAKLNSTLAGFSQWAGAPENAETVRRMVTGFAALGAFLVGGGAIAIIAALGPAGWLVGGLAALAVALTNPSFREWLKSDSISKAIEGWMQPLKEWLKSDSIAQMFSGLGTKVVGALKSAIDAVIAAVPGILSGLGAAIMNALKNAVSGALGAIGSHPQADAPAFGKALGGAGAAPMRYDAVPPPRGGGGVRIINAKVHMKKQFVGVMTASIVDSAAGPIQGSAYPDAMRRQARTDHSYSHA